MASYETYGRFRIVSAGVVDDAQKLLEQPDPTPVLAGGLDTSTG